MRALDLFAGEGNDLMPSERLIDREWVGRLVAFLVGGSLIASGLRRLFAGQLHYSNYWGGAVFAPFAIVIGTFLVLLVIFKRRDRPQEKLRGRAARRERQAEKVKFPIDEYHKW